MTKIVGEIAPGVPPNGAKKWSKCVVFCDQSNTFGHLSYTDFDNFRNNRRESMCNATAESPNSSVPKMSKMGNFKRVFFIDMQLKWHNFG